MVETTGLVLDAVRSAMASVRLENGGYLSLNESETRAHLIDPVVAALGYVTLDHVRRELKLEASGQFVDYLLFAGEARIVVEAKSLGAELAPKDASQLVGYCAQEGVRWALLTNGLQWQVYDIEVKGNWQSKRIATLDFWLADKNGELGATSSTLGHFARAALMAGDDELQAWARAERSRTLLEGLLRNPASPVIRAVLKEMAALGIELEPSEAVQLLQAGSVPRPQPPLVLEPSNQGSTKPLAVTLTPQIHYFVFPVGAESGFKPEAFLHAWLPSGQWGVRVSTPHRTRISAGDQCCFYIPKVGVVARAVISGRADVRMTPANWPGPNDYSADVFRVPLESVEWLPAPLPINAALRAAMDAFVGKDASKPWAWLIQTTNQLTEHDFRLLVGQLSD
jgi:hypothetical protein